MEIGAGISADQRTGEAAYRFVQLFRKCGHKKYSESQR